MKYDKINEEVLYSAERVTRLGDRDMQELVELARRNPRKRVRLCTHASPADSLHNMFIVHGCDAYVRPHKHRRNDESIHVLSGFADMVFFDEDGCVTQAFRIGDFNSGHPFYCRIPSGELHMIIIRSEVLVFAESTTGPFEPSGMECPDWAPEDGTDDVWGYVERISKRIEKL